MTNNLADFQPFPKLARLARGCCITEKLDGTNAQVVIDEEGNVRAGSRTRWISPGKNTDNYGFAQWVEEHKEELLKLGRGRHYGEWFGNGIQRNYGLSEKRFALFNVMRPIETLPSCVTQVPIIATGKFDDATVNWAMTKLRLAGSVAAPGFMNPEGIVIFHKASNMYFKKTLENDDEPKGQSDAETAALPKYNAKDGI